MTDNKVVQWKNSLAFNFSEIDFCTFVVSDECLELNWKQCARLWSWIAWFEEEKKKRLLFSSAWFRRRKHTWDYEDRYETSTPVLSREKVYDFHRITRIFEP